MLHWSIALVATPVVATLLLMSTTAHRLGTAIGRPACRTINNIGAWLSRILDIVLRPREYDGGVCRSRLALWTGMNAGTIIAIYHARATGHGSVALISAALLAGFHAMLAAASILKIAEENRIMHVGQPRSGARFAPRAAVRNLAVIALEAVLVIGSAAALLDMASGAWPGVLLIRTPGTGLSFADHLVCLLSALPIVGMLVEISDFAGEVAFGGPFGTSTRGIIYAIGSTLLLGAMTAWLVQRINISTILDQLENAESDDAHFLQLILSRAPMHIKSDLLAVALDASRPRAQLRAINTMRHLKVWTFPQTFLHQLDGFDRKISIAGLNQIKEFLACDGAAFADQLLVVGAYKVLERYAARAPGAADQIEDAVLSRLGALGASYITLVQSRALNFRTTKELYGVMLEVAKAHKDSDVRRTMAKALMLQGAKGFILHFLGSMHERGSDAVDVEIIEGFVGYARANQKSLEPEARATIARRINWTLRNCRQSREMEQALKALLSEVTPMRLVGSTSSQINPGRKLA